MGKGALPTCARHKDFPLPQPLERGISGRLEQTSNARAGSVRAPGLTPDCPGRREARRGVGAARTSAAARGQGRGNGNGVRRLARLNRVAASNEHHGGAFVAV